MTNTAQNLISITPYQSYKARVDATTTALKDAVIAHVKAVMELKNSGTWRESGESNWPSYCATYLPFAAKTYSSYSAELPLALAIIEATVNTALSPNDSRKIREKFAEIVDPEDRRLIPEVWSVCYAYDDSAIVPNANVIKAAYEVIKQERDNRSVSINGESFDIKAMAQKVAVKEAVLENIQAHSQASQKWTTEVSSFEMQKAIAALLPQGMKAPAIGSMVTLLWKKEAE
jgi:hypothetical protein